MIYVGIATPRITNLNSANRVQVVIKEGGCDESGRPMPVTRQAHRVDGRWQVVNPDGTAPSRRRAATKVAAEVKGLAAEVKGLTNDLAAVKAVRKKFGGRTPKGIRLQAGILGDFLRFRLAEAEAEMEEAQDLLKTTNADYPEFVFVVVS